MNMDNLQAIAKEVETLSPKEIVEVFADKAKMFQVRIKLQSMVNTGGVVGGEAAKSIMEEFQKLVLLGELLTEALYSKVDDTIPADVQSSDELSEDQALTGQEIVYYAGSLQYAIRNLTLGMAGAVGRGEDYNM